MRERETEDARRRLFSARDTGLNPLPVQVAELQEPRIVATERGEMTAAGPLDRLLFRRQFVLGPTPFAPSPRWSCRSLRHGLVLSSHPDLQVFSESLDGATITLMGFALDPINPARTEPDIVRSLSKDASDISKLIALTKPLAGRWAVIYQNPAGTYLFTDPCGFRAVFYHRDGRDLWCGSQPEIIRANCRLRWNTDEKLLQFLMSPASGRGESAWVGAQTVYGDCLHLLPNHYLDVNRLEQIRFFPAGPLPILETSAVVEVSRTMLEGILAGMVRRQSVLMAFTSGWDSRVLLAASRSVSSEVQYYVDRMGVLPGYHPDVRVPQRLAKRLGISFLVRDSADDMPGWFSSALSANVTGARMLPKTRSICASLISGEERTVINGVGGEISRNDWDDCSLDPQAVTTRDIVRTFFRVDHPFLVQEADRWRQRLPELDDRVNALVLFFWEQRLGNWGAQYVAEQDIAVDTLHPFNCRLLIETMLSTPRRMRAAPSFSLFRQLIQAMWPEVMSVPFYHYTLPRVVTINFRALEERMRPYVPSPIRRRLKDLASRCDPARRNA